VEATTGTEAVAISRSASGPLSAPKPMLLFVEYTSSAADGMRIAVRLQRPSLAVDIGFLLAVGRFFVPSLAGGTAEAAEAVLPADVALRPGGVAAAFLAKAVAKAVALRSALLFALAFATASSASAVNATALSASISSGRASRRASILSMES
jgi:hypothetical protein